MNRSWRFLCSETDLILPVWETPSGLRHHIYWNMSSSRSFTLPLAYKQVISREQKVLLPVRFHNGTGMGE